MRIVFFSDIHGNLCAFRAFQTQLTIEKPDMVVFCGDVFGYYYHQNEILADLLASGWTCLLGNHDNYFLKLLDNKMDVEQLCQKYGSSYRRCIEESRISQKHAAFLRGLKSHETVTVGGLKIAVFHGSPTDPLEGRVYPDTPITDAEKYTPYDFVILGHTHHKMVRKVGNTTVINSGSLGQQRDGRGCSYLLFDTRERSYQFKLVQYDVKCLMDEIERNDPDKEFLMSVLTRTAPGRVCE